MFYCIVRSSFKRIFDFCQTTKHLTYQRLIEKNNIFNPKIIKIETLKCDMIEHR